MRNVRPAPVKHSCYEAFDTGALLIVPLPAVHESNMFVARRKRSSQGSGFIFSTLLKKNTKKIMESYVTEIESGHCVFFPLCYLEITK